MASTSSIGVKHPVIHFEIMGRDPAALSKFYADVFGWSLRPPMAGDPMEYVAIDTVPEDNNVISGGIGKAPEGYDGHVTFYIRVDDVEAALKPGRDLGNLVDQDLLDARIGALAHGLVERTESDSLLRVELGIAEAKGILSVRRHRSTREERRVVGIDAVEPG